MAQQKKKFYHFREKIWKNHHPGACIITLLSNATRVLISAISEFNIFGFLFVTFLSHHEAKVKFIIKSFGTIIDTSSAKLFNLLLTLCGN